VISGSLWDGAPNRLLEAARAGRIDLFTSVEILEEMADVLGRPKFEQRLLRSGVTVAELTQRFADLATCIDPPPLPAPVILADPEDDAILACALAVEADFIVSGDSHLIQLKAFHGIPIITASALLRGLEP
jgi:uncharacterized protein